jgi:hypothetical protein
MVRHLDEPGGTASLSVARRVELVRIKAAPDKPEGIML